MRHTYPHLTGKGLLTAFIACLFSGQTLADIAGRVNFVSGKVQAVTADGTRRNLVKGELVNSGERLETNTGRVQIRFTDGSFISLQPNTVFNLDQYAFDKAKPNEGSLLFNFIRGSMRTVSGAIGKVNRNNYKVQTPVATIGIRGTSYAATQEPNGRLLLTVGSGIVNLANDFGDSDVGAGQTFQVDTGKAPTNAPKGTSVGARANDPESKQEQNKENQDGQNDRQKPDFVFANQVDKDGKLLAVKNIEEQQQKNEEPPIEEPPKEPFIQTVNGFPRLSSFGSLLEGSSGVKIYANVIAGYDALSVDGKTVGNLIRVLGTSLTDTENPNLTDKLLLNVRSNNNLKFSNVQQIGSLSFGAWTNGTASVVDPYLGTVQQLTLSDAQFMPYIVGTTAEKVVGNNMKASYSLAGSLAKGAGTLTELNIDIDLNLMPLVSVDMAATLNNINYHAQLNKAPLLDISFDKKFSGFILSGEGNGLYASSSTASLCADNQCPVTLSAFLSSNDMGVVYEIFRNESTLLSGVAALTGNESVINREVNPQSLASTLDGKYSALFKSSNSNVVVDDTTNLAAVFDSQSNGLMSAFHVNNEGSEKIAQDFYGALNAANTLAAETKDIGHVAKSLSWGRWTNGRVDIGKDANGGVLLGANDNIHYLIGLPTPDASIPNIGSVRYNLAGGTASAIFGTGTSQQTVTSHDIGQVISGNLVVDFGRNTSELNFTVSGFTKASNLQSLNVFGSTSLASASNNLNFNDLNVTASSATGVLGCIDCTASAHGLFFGDVSPIGQSTQTAPAAAGLTYNITGTVEATEPASMDVKGVAGFNNPQPFVPNVGS